MIDIIMPLGLLAMFVFGVMLGWRSAKRPKYPYAGTLCINYDDPNKELLALRLSVGLDELEKMSDILIMVDVDCDQKSDPKISQGKNS